MCWQVGGAGWRSVLPCVTCWGPAALSAPVYAPGDTTGQDSWFVLEECRARQGGYGGAGWGMGLQMGRSRLGVDGAGWGERGTVGVLLWEELLSTKGTSARLNGQWPRAIRWMIMTLCWLRPQGTWSRVPVCVCMCVCGCVCCQLASQWGKRVRKNRNCGSLDGWDKDTDD